MIGAFTDLLPGARHNAHVFGAHGLEKLFDSSTLADKGYASLRLATPTKRRPSQRLSGEAKENNRVINTLRSVVKPVIAQVKTRRVLHAGFRRPLGMYGRVFSSDRWAGVFGCWRDLNK